MFCVHRAADGPAPTPPVPQTPAVSRHPPRPAAPHPRRSAALQPSSLALLPSEEQPWRRRRRRGGGSRSWSSPPAAVGGAQPPAVASLPQQQPEVQFGPRLGAVSALQPAVRAVSFCGGGEEQNWVRTLSCRLWVRTRRWGGYIRCMNAADRLRSDGLSQAK